MVRKIQKAFPVFVASLLLAGVLFPACQQKPPTETQLIKVSIRLQWVHQAQFAGVYVAKEKGFYSEKGLDVTIFPGGADFNAIKLVAAGSNDFGIWTADQLVLARAQGVPVKAISAVFQKSLACFIAKESSGIKSPRDFVGKKVGMAYGYDSETLYVAMLKKLGVDRSKIREIPVQYDLARFWRGEIDVWPAYRINQPITAEQLGVPINIIDPAEFGIESYSDVLFTTDKMIYEKPALVEAFLSATLKGWQWALSHPEEAARIVLQQDSHLDYQHELAMLRIEAPLVQPSPEVAVGTMRRSVWESIRRMLLDQGALKTDVQLEDVYTTEFLRKLGVNAD